MVFYRRRLPHWQPAGKSFFVTWRLYGSLPKAVAAGNDGRTIKNGGHASKLDDLLSYEDFIATDSELDRAQCGPRWLADPRVEDMVVEALRFSERTLDLYCLSTFVIMPNHVHVLWTPRTPLESITRRLKGFTSLRANRILGRVGQRFWQDESFDHWIRSDADFERIAGYIEDNPVKAGIVRTPQEWKWSSAGSK